jgi:hypothetical protein
MFERPGEGLYESFFVRGNHPSRALAFWIRYTVLVPAGRGGAAVAELWAIAFDGERERVVAVKERHPLSTAAFERHRLSLRIGAASFEQGSLRGAARTDAHRVAWALDYEATQPPLLLLPEAMYAGRFPKAKSLVPAPLARFRGALEVDGEVVDVDGWVGSQNHNWGSRHTDRYAWGQVAGFDGEPNAFLECATAQLRFGPLWTPRLTVIALRLPDGEQLLLNAIGTALRAHAQRERFEWRFESAAAGARVQATLRAAPQRFVALRYDNPSGPQKICLNSKLASCELRVERKDKPVLELRTQHRAAFEILGDDAEGVPIAF